MVGHGGPVMDVAVSPDGTKAATGSFDNSVGFWSLETDQVVWFDGHEAAVKTVVFAGEDRVISGGDDFAIEIWDTTSGTSIRRLTGHQGQIASLAV